MKRKSRSAKYLRPGLILAAGICLSACTPMQWVKSDFDDLRFSEDSVQCQQQAQREISLHSWNSYPSVPIVGLNAQGQSIGLWYHDFFVDPFGDRFMEERRLTDLCLQAKGYSLVPVPSAKSGAAQ